MEIKGTYSLSYTLDKELKEMKLIVELKQIDGMMKKGQNVWEGKATLDGLPYEKENLSYCVNAKLAAERIGNKLKNELKESARVSGQSFRVKKEEIK